MHISLDNFLPQYDIHELHSVTVSAPAAAAYSAARNLKISEMPALIFLMMALRDLPAWLLGKRSPEKPGLGTENMLDMMLSSNFTLLEEAPGREIVFGMIGEFWRLAPSARKIAGPQDFLACDAAGCVKVAANFLVQEQGGKSVVSTETRIWAQDAAGRRKFRWYWMVIALGSGLIRILWLRAIRRKAEKRQSLPLEGGG